MIVKSLILLICVFDCGKHLIQVKLFDPAKLFERAGFCQTHQTADFRTPCKPPLVKPRNPLLYAYTEFHRGKPVDPGQNF